MSSVCSWSHWPLLCVCHLKVSANSHSWDTKHGHIFISKSSQRTSGYSGPQRLWLQTKWQTMLRHCMQRHTVAGRDRTEGEKGKETDAQAQCLFAFSVSSLCLLTISDLASTFVCPHTNWIRYLKSSYNLSTLIPSISSLTHRLIICFTGERLIKLNHNGQDVCVCVCVCVCVYTFHCITVTGTHDKTLMSCQ